MENTKSMITWKLMSENRAYNSDAIIASLYLYYVDRFSGDNKYSAEALEVTQRIYGSDRSYEDNYGLIDSCDFSLYEFREFAKAVVESLDTYHAFRASGGDSPEQLAVLCSKLLDFKNGDVVMDEGSGNGAALTIFADEASKTNTSIKLAGIELNPDRVFISKLYLTILGVDAEIVQGDALKTEQFPEYNKAYVLPPFGMIFSSTEDDVISKKYGSMFNFKANSEWLFVFRLLSDLKSNGRVVAVLPAGTLYRNNGRDIRSYLVENKLIEGIVYLPGKVLPNTSIPVVVLVLGSNKGSIKMVDAAEMALPTESKMLVSLEVDRIITEYNSNAVNVSYEEVANNDYNLNPNLYFGSIEIEIPYETKISDIASIEVGSQYTVAKFKDKISKTPTDYQILTSSDINNGIVDYDALTYIEPDRKLLKFALQENDMVITTKSTKVKTFVARNLPNRNIVVTGGMLILHPDTTKIDPTFLKLFLDSNTGAQLMQRIMQGFTIKTISLKDFANLSVSCPPLEKQAEYSKKYNSLLSMYEGVLEQLNEIQSKLDSFYEDRVEAGEV